MTTNFDATDLSDLDAHDVGDLFAGDDDRETPLELTPQLGDMTFQYASAFLKMLDRGRDHCEFRTFDDMVSPDGSKRADPTLTRTIGGTLRQALPDLKRMNALGAGVFVTVNRTDGKGRTTKHVTDVVAVFADTDGADIQPLLVLKPHIVVVSSPGNWHSYWLVADCKLPQFKPLQQAIAAKYGTDPVIHDLPRVMRVPGFNHNKHAPFPITLAPELMDPGREPYTVQEVVEGLNLRLHVSNRDMQEVDLEPNVSTEKSPPPVDTMRAMLQHLADRNYFADRGGVVRDASSITKVGWIQTGMALKLAYDDDDGLDLWNVTHIDNQARADAPVQWASFATEPQPGHITIGTIIKAAKDAGFVFPTLRTDAAASGHVSYGPFTMDANGGLTKQVMTERSQNSNIKAVWISAPFEILGQCRDPQGRTWGKQIQFRDADGRAHMRHVSDAALQGEPGALCAELADEGLRINRSKQRELAEYHERPLYRRACYYCLPHGLARSRRPSRVCPAYGNDLLGHGREDLARYDGTWPV